MVAEGSEPRKRHDAACQRQDGRPNHPVPGEEKLTPREKPLRLSPLRTTQTPRRWAFSRNRITGLPATHTGPAAGTLEQGGSAFVTGQAGRVFAPASMPTWRTTAAIWSCGPGLPLSVSHRKRRKTWSSRRDRRPGGSTAPFLATGRSGSASRRSPTSTGRERQSSISTDPKPGHRAPCGMPNPN